MIQHLILKTVVVVAWLVFSGHLSRAVSAQDSPYTDRPFIQEYHEGHIPADTPGAKDVRAIAVDRASNVWIGTSDGVFVKSYGQDQWKPIIVGPTRGPAYAVAVDRDNVVWLGTWNGVYSYSDLKLIKHDSVSAPISVICRADEGIYCLVDVDGTPTRWGVWSPTKLNTEPDWASERALNSFELLTYLKFAYHVSGENRYQREYLRLIHEEGYLENATHMNRKNPAWFIYFDVSLAGYLFPILLKVETDPQLRKRYEALIDEWFEQQIRDQCPLHNFIYGLARNRYRELDASIHFLIDPPLDLVDWRIDHSKREDIQIVRRPTLEEFQTHVLVPPSIRATVRWDRNPWAAVNGNPRREREPVFWLFPYWLGRHIGMIVE